MNRILCVIGELLELLALAVLTVVVLGALGVAPPSSRCSAAAPAPSPARTVVSR